MLKYFTHIKYMRNRTYIMGVLFIVLISVGFFLKANAFPGSGTVLSVGMTLFILGFAISFTIDKISLERKLIGKMSQIVLSFSMVLIIIGPIFKLLHLPASSILSLSGVIMFSIYLVFFTRHSEGRKLIMQKDRQLASILFTDIVGFTKMMGANEDNTLLALDRNRSIQKRHIRKHRGRWIKEMGDGSIAIFYTASEAIQCAIDIQKEIQEKEDFKIRMGVHISEILFTEKDIFGDGVNVASRISSMAGANEICFSTIVYHNIRNREEIKIERIGIQQLKNVTYEVDIYKIVV